MEQKINKKRRKRMKTKKIKEETYDFAKRGTHLPNKMHLDACQQGSRVYRNRKKYTRKGKCRFSASKELSW